MQQEWHCIRIPAAQYEEWQWFHNRFQQRMMWR